MSKPTPTRGGAWRVLADGSLVDESHQEAAAPIEQIPPGEPIPVVTEVRAAEPGESLPPIEPAPKSRQTKSSTRRKAPSNAQ